MDKRKFDLKPHPLNDRIGMECKIYAVKNGKRFITCWCHDTDTAREIAWNFISLGYEVEIDDAFDYKVLFDSEYDVLEKNDNGEIRAVYLMGAND